ncbi:hypothetical protein GC173_15215 [bacterium]|nr:hypothetical protein [bacterium]
MTVNSNEPFRIKIDGTDTPADGDLERAYAELEKEASGSMQASTPLPTDMRASSQPTPLPQQTTTALTPLPLDPRKSANRDTPTDRPLTKYEEMCRAKSLNIGAADVKVIAEFSQIIAAVNEATRMLDRLEKTYPDQLPDRLLTLIRENLRDSTQTMLKELHAMRNGRVQKKYDKKYVCCECHTVFLVPLPADNVCDACRASSVPRSAPY